MLEKIAGGEVTERHAVEVCCKLFASASAKSLNSQLAAHHVRQILTRFKRTEGRAPVEEDGTPYHLGEAVKVLDKSVAALQALADSVPAAAIEAFPSIASEMLAAVAGATETVNRCAALRLVHASQQKEKQQESARKNAISRKASVEATQPWAVNGLGAGLRAFLLRHGLGVRASTSSASSPVPVLSRKPAGGCLVDVPTATARGTEEVAATFTRQRCLWLPECEESVPHSLSA